MTQWLRRYIAWLALSSVLFVSIAPSFSHLLASATNGTVWVEICSLYGSKRVALDVESDKTIGYNTSSTPQCLFCRLQNDLPVIPSLEYFVTFEATFAYILPESVAYSPPRTRFIRTAHLTRAPPSIS